MTTKLLNSFLTFATVVIIINFSSYVSSTVLSSSPLSSSSLSSLEPNPEPYDDHNRYLKNTKLLLTSFLPSMFTAAAAAVAPSSSLPSATTTISSTLLPAPSITSMAAIIITDTNLTTITSSTTTDSNYDVIRMQIILYLTALFYGTAFILGAIGNGLIIYIVAHYSRMRTLCNVFLASLATADLLLVFLCIPVKFVQLMTYTWTLGECTCKLLHYVQNVSAFCSVLTLTTMSVERYYAIIHPVECRTTFSMHHIKKIIFVIWILALIMASPVLYVYILITLSETDAPGGPYYWCVKISSHWEENVPNYSDNWPQWRRVYETYQLVTILIVPAIIMTYTYTCICTHLWTIVHRRTAIRYGHDCHIVTTTISSTGSNGSTATLKMDHQIKNSVIVNNGNGVGVSAATAVPAAVAGSSATSPTINSSTAVSSSTSASASASSSSSSTSSSSSSSSSSCNGSGSGGTTGGGSSNSSNSSNGSNGSCSVLTKNYQQRSIEEDNQTVKQVVKMLVAVVVLFVLCWTPMLCINLLKGWELVVETNEGFLREAVTIAYLLAYLNSVLNPFIYGFMSKNFRLHFKLVLQQCWTVVCCSTGQFTGIGGGGRRVGSFALKHKSKLQQKNGAQGLNKLAKATNFAAKPNHHRNQSFEPTLMVGNNNNHHQRNHNGGGHLTTIALRQQSFDCDWDIAKEPTGTGNNNTTVEQQVRKSSVTTTLTMLPLEPLSTLLLANDETEEQQQKEEKNVKGKIQNIESTHQDNPNSHHHINNHWTIVMGDSDDISLVDDDDDDDGVHSNSLDSSTIFQGRPKIINRLDTEVEVIDIDEKDEKEEEEEEEEDQHHHYDPKEINNNFQQWHSPPPAPAPTPEPIEFVLDSSNEV